MTDIAALCDAAEKLWPGAGAEAWDSIGLVVGRRQAPVTHVRFCVDVTPEVIADAAEAGVDFLVAHHPLLLRGVTDVREDAYKGASIAELIRRGMGLLTAHTNADAVESGVSDCLAASLGLGSAEPIVAGLVPGAGIGRVGELPEPVPLGALARRLASVLPATAQGIRVAGEYERRVSRVAVCGGAGDSLLQAEAVLNSDVFITSDLRHHPALEFRESAKLKNGPALIDVSHWASEWLWLTTAAQQFRDRFPSLTVSVSDVRTDPWDFLVVQ